MSAYLTGYEDNDFEFVPCFHSVRAADFSIWNSFPVRFVRDVFIFVSALITKTPQIVHVMAQYRKAIPRELVCCWIARLFGKKVFYEIKAGIFDTRYKQGGYVYRWMVRRVLKCSTEIGIEGQRYASFVESICDRQTTFLPNVCLRSEVPESVTPKFRSDVLRVIFVGYCYEGKGTFELVEGCMKAVEDGCKIELQLAGEQSKPFQAWIRGKKLPKGLSLQSLGRIDHKEVLSCLSEADIFCMPSKHSGEGHNNSVNEAMMCGCLVVCTKHGFLGDILNSQIAIFLDELTPEAIARKIVLIESDRASAAAKCGAARTYFNQNFVSDVVFPRLTVAYKRMLAS